MVHARNDQTNTGSILEYINFNHVSVSAKDSSPKITNCVFNDPFWTAVLSTDGGSPTITNNIIENVGTEGISIGGSSVVTNNLFNVTSGEATAIVAHDNAYVSNNEILDFYNGITAGDSSTIKGNSITNCSNAGIWSISANANIESNYLAKNNIGVIYGGGNVENNAIINNGMGIQIQNTPSSVEISNNNIVGNTQNSINIWCNSNIDASNNWWEQPILKP